MFSRVVQRCMAVVAAVALVAAGASPVLAAPSTADARREKEVIVSFDPSAREEALAAVRVEGGQVLRLLRSGTEALAVFPERTTVQGLSDRLKHSGSVRRVAPNLPLRLAWVPNDPLYPKQWALGSIRLPSAWNLTRGSASVTVALIDSGVDISHPDLAAILDLVHDWDFVRDDSTADEEHLHGTHVAGIVAAVADNATGVAGVAPLTRVLPLKVVGRTGVAGTADFVDALRYAADVGAKVVNVSLGEELDPGIPEEAAVIAVLQVAVDYARAKGVLVIAAAGNGGGPPVWYPAACDGVVAVSATARDGTTAPYSSTGPEVDVAAPGGWAPSPADLPGGGVISTWNGGGYSFAQGTSMAAPHVAGIVALLLALRPDSSPAELQAVVEASAQDIGSPGFDRQTGHGLVQADAAVGRLGRVSRVAGADRYATAVAASAAVFASSECTTVVIASGERFPDALAASPLAGMLRSPVLLVKRDSVPGSTLSEIARLVASRAVIVGGPGAVGEEVALALARAGLAVERIGGSDRYQTAAMVARRVRASGPPTATVLVARGDAFPDGVAASGPAASSRSPLVLVRPDALPASAKEAIAAAVPCSVVVLGGEGAVSAAVVDEIAAIPGVVGVKRWGGADRYATAAVIAEQALESGLCDADLVAVASGADFPDALSGGAAAGARRGTVVLTPPLSLSQHVHAFVSRALGPAGTGWVLGGTGALSWTVQADLIRAMP